jgi:hypothetical protein
MAEILEYTQRYVHLDLKMPRGLFEALIARSHGSDSLALREVRHQWEHTMDALSSSLGGGPLARP